MENYKMEVTSHPPLSRFRKANCISEICFVKSPITASWRQKANCVSVQIIKMSATMQDYAALCFVTVLAAVMYCYHSYFVLRARLHFRVPH
jgi:hypothetical protein